MGCSEQLNGEMTVVMGAEAMAAAIRRMAQEIVAAHPDIESLALLGILRRGRPLADRLAAHIAEMTEITPRVGSLSTTLYRDDLRAGMGVVKVRTAETHFDFPLDGLTVVLVDDVIAAGRTIRAALDELMDYGRPARIQLACLVDRGCRELPIQPDYLGQTVATKCNERIYVQLAEIDGQDVVLIENKDPEAEI